MTATTLFDLIERLTSLMRIWNRQHPLLAELRSGRALPCSVLRSSAWACWPAVRSAISGIATDARWRR